MKLEAQIEAEMLPGNAMFFHTEIGADASNGIRVLLKIPYGDIIVEFRKPGEDVTTRKLVAFRLNDLAVAAERAINQAEATQKNDSVIDQLDAPQDRIFKLT